MKQFFLCLFLALPLLAQHPLGRLQPPNLSLSSGIDMRGGPLLREGNVLYFVDSENVTNTVLIAPVGP